MSSGDVSLNMLVVAYFRFFNQQVPRKKIQESLAYLKKIKMVEGLGGTYYRFIGA
jgi:hypothetical protein